MSLIKLLKRMSGGVTIAVVSLWPAVTFAQDAAPPAPTLSRSQPVWIGFGLMLLLVAAVVTISLMPSKRSHQD